MSRPTFVGLPNRTVLKSICTVSSLHTGIYIVLLLFLIIVSSRSVVLSLSVYF